MNLQPDCGFNYRKYDVEIIRNPNPDELQWPARRETVRDSSLGGNFEYADLRRLSWVKARRIFDLESELIARIESAEDAEEESVSIDDYLYSIAENLYGLDVGVASTVVCLSASGCIPFASCNAGAFGGHHQEAHPLVAFFARSREIKHLVETAAEADLGLVNGPAGSLIAYAKDIRDFRKFAAGLLRGAKMANKTRI